MVAKRGYDENPDQPGDKRTKRVIREAINVNSEEISFPEIEPFLRRVVQEEIEKGLGSISRVVQEIRALINNSPRYIDRSPRMRTEVPMPSLYWLDFKCQPKLPIYTDTKIEDIKGEPLQILLVVDPNGSPMSLPSPIKIELVVLDGDFPLDGTDDWTSEEFNKCVVKERAGKRPLLTGDVSNITMRDGEVSIGELQFTDNSSWIRSGNFRIAVRVVPGSYEGPRIREAMTDKFVVRDKRGELYKKHYPPYLHDEVWRLEKIGKTFHRKLQESNINNVQDFLQSLNVDQKQLRKILGPGMSDKMWEVTVNHAKTCYAGEKVDSHSDPTPNREADEVPNTSIALIQSETVIQGPAGTPPWYPYPPNLVDFFGGLDQDGASTNYEVDYTEYFPKWV